MAEAVTNPAKERRGAKLRVLLLVGLAIAVVVPFVIFAWLGDRELRRATKDNLGRHLMVSEARGTARRVADRLEQARDLAETFSSTPVLRARFDDSVAARTAFARFHSRVSELLGSVLLVAPAKGGADEPARVLFPDERARGTRRLPPELLASWLEDLDESAPRYRPPIPDPLAPAGSLSAPRDPESWVLPLLVPIRDDTQVARGVCVFLLPLVTLQDEIEERQRSLIDGADIGSTTAWIVDRETGRYLLHTERDRIGQPAELSNLEGFTERGIETLAGAQLGRRGLPAWSAGLGADGAELFRSVDSLSTFFLGLVVLVLAATLGIGALISVGATRSLSRLEQTTAKLGAGDSSARAEVAGPREVRTLAQEFNRMADRLEEEQERLRHAERDRAWTKMARQVAHEIKNPLQPVRLHAELIARGAAEAGLDSDKAERVRNSAEVILRQVDALRRIVADFSEYAHAAMPIKERVRFRASAPLAELAALYSASRAGDTSVAIDDQSGDAELLGSPLRLQQVLVNLVKNAIEASEGSESAVVEIFAQVVDDRWVVEIRDRGHGLPAGGQQQAFEPSFSTKAGGTGLGLAICRRNLDAMDGSVELVPRDGGGAIARIRVPLAT